MYDPIARTGGLLHFMLPSSDTSRDRPSLNPYAYADSGVPLLLERMRHRGCVSRNLLVWLAGGARIMDEQGFFDIGRRNYAAVRSILWKTGVLVAATAVGGCVSRTIRLHVGTGTFSVKETESDWVTLGSPIPANRYCHGL